MTDQKKKKRVKRNITPQKGTAFGDKVRAMFGVGSDARLDRIKKRRKK